MSFLNSLHVAFGHTIQQRAPVVSLVYPSVILINRTESFYPTTSKSGLCRKHHFNLPIHWKLTYFTLWWTHKEAFFFSRSVVTITIYNIYVYTYIYKYVSFYIQHNNNCTRDGNDCLYKCVVHFSSCSTLFSMCVCECVFRAEQHNMYPLYTIYVQVYVYIYMLFIIWNTFQVFAHAHDYIVVKWENGKMWNRVTQHFLFFILSLFYKHLKRAAFTSYIVIQMCVIVD